MEGIQARVRRGARVVVTAAAALAGCAIALPAAPTGAATVVNATIQSVAQPLTSPVVGLAATTTGKGYWRATRDGRVLTTGDATMYGSALGRVGAPVVGMTATPSGHGYWLVDARGGIYGFGDAGLLSVNVVVESLGSGEEQVAEGSYALLVSLVGVEQNNADKPFLGAVVRRLP